jgi:hypothetical protein
MSDVMSVLTDVSRESVSEWIQGVRPWSAT